MKKLFTERHGQVKPRTGEVLHDTARKALVTLVCTCIDQDWFGFAFPQKCIDGYAFAGTNTERMRATMEGLGVPWLPDYAHRIEELSDGMLFDAVEFAFEHVAQALNPQYHSYGNHSHYTYDQLAGREQFASDVNRIFERNGLAFELVDGEVIRLTPAVLDDALGQAAFRSGDVELDGLLNTARSKFMHRDLSVRKEALEKLWDAWERLKTVELPAQDKKTSSTALLQRAAKDPTLFRVLNDEAVCLTSIGNNFMIRHSEVGKVPLTESMHVDYLFHRLFAMVLLLLRASDRGG